MLASAKRDGVILMHDWVQQTVQVMPKLLTTLEKRGYHMVTVTKMLGPREPARSLRDLAHTQHDVSAFRQPVADLRNAAVAQAEPHLVRPERAVVVGPECAPARA